ncbi:hypothetical protein C0989_006544 [Termitomyces sp. Mn162]|nr:hypothetical protein C0989_006544 [Termitomyces sp. Mn162]
MVGPPGFCIYSPTPGTLLGWASSSLEPPPSITEVFLRKQVEVLTVVSTAWEGELCQAREDRDVAWAEKEALEQVWNTLVRVATERAPEVRGLQERLMQWEVQPTVGVEDLGNGAGGWFTGGGAGGSAAEGGLAGQ